MTYEEAMDKAAKLLRLSKSANPHEAALAASRAQEIMERFKIESLSVDYDGTKAAPDEPIKDFGFDPLEVTGRKSSWKIRLAVSISKVNQCKVYLKGASIALIGRASDVSTCRYIYAWLVRECDRLTLAECRGCGLSYANNFRLGVVDTITARLKESLKETHNAMEQEAKAEGVNPFALVRVQNALAQLHTRAQAVELWTAQNKKLTAGRRTHSAFNPNARQHGQQAGNSIRLKPARATLSC